MAANLIIEVGADVKAAVDGLKVIDNSLSNTGSVVNKMKERVEQFRRALKLATDPKDTETLTKGINTLNSQIRQIQRAGNPLKGFHNGVLQSERTLSGFDGVIRNISDGTGTFGTTITSLLENFLRLRTETGGTQNALKTLTHEFISGGGLVVGLGIAIPIVEALGEALFSSGDGAKEQAEKIKKAKQALADYVDSLNDIDQARVKGLQSAQEELVKLKSIYDATQNTNIAIGQRKKLVDELQEQYPKYFANIKDEVILAGGAKKAYDELSTAILASAKARAAQDVLVDIQKQILAVDQEIAGNTVNKIKLQQQLNNLSKQPLTITSATGEERLTSVGAKANKVQQSLNGFVSEGNDLFKQRNDLLSRAQVLSANISQTIEKNPESLLNPTGNLPKVAKEKKDDTLEKELAAKKEIVLDFVKDFETIKVKFPDLSKSLEDFDIKGLTTELRFKLANALTGLTKDLSAKQGVDIKKIKFQVPLNPSITWSKTELVEKIESFNKELQNLIVNSEVTAFAAFGQGIADAINGGGIESAFKGIVGIMGDFLQELGKMLIKSAVIAQAFKKAFAALIANPASAIGVGIGLVALGGIIKNAVLPKPKGFAEGGLVFGPTFGLIGEGRGTSRNNPEVVAPLDKLQRMLGGVALGGSQVFIPDVKIRGNDLVLVFNKASKSQLGNMGRGGF
jgi:hypothetical protein